MCLLHQCETSFVIWYTVKLKRYILCFVTGYFLGDAPPENIQHYHRTFGQKVTLACDAPESTKSSDWFYQDLTTRSVQQVSSAGLVINGYLESGRFTLSPGISHDASLNVRNLTPDDSGLYICRAKNHKGQYVEHKFWLTVQGKNFVTTISLCRPRYYYYSYYYYCYNQSINQ